ncbi:uncharacterized protein CCR75_000229 [Bremia lactucae]|uniref:Transcription factor IIIC 90kDa subunit N-terminal domain-containing protein n=1 Tax=Bremia lactucae TaxID=4779 RepID=A0A976FEE0_BRELC|nr:hypothetical protein CCR75_000229 [Bremia lactucae]
MTTDQSPSVELLPIDVNSRERIPGSPLVPGGVSWSEDGRLAVVADSNILVSTFRSRELEMFQPDGPAVSKDFVFLPDNPVNEHVPVAIPPSIELLDGGLPQNSTTYFLLNDNDRHQHNPKELSLSKNTGAAFIAAVWGPRGSASSSSCALLALTASSRLSLHFPPSFHLNWKEVAVLSEGLFKFLQSKNFRLGPSHDSRLNKVPLSSVIAGLQGDRKYKKQKVDQTKDNVAMNSIAEYTHQCAMISTMTIAWSPFMMTVDKQTTTSLIALSGRKVSTIWAYTYPSFDTNQHFDPFDSTAPIAWIDTNKYGWVTTSTWQKMHQNGTTYATHEDLGLALGTSEGNVLIAKVPVTASTQDSSPQQVTVERVIAAPYAQPVYGLCMGSYWTYSNSLANDLIVASGSTISVWNLKKKKQAQPNAQWKAHDGNLTGIGLNYFGDAILSAAVDGTIKGWEKASGRMIYSSDANHTSLKDKVEVSAKASKYPIYGLAMSPSSAQVACLFIAPPASRPNRKSQADISYSRVCCSLEYIPSPWVKSSAQMADVVCRILNDSQSVSSFMDVVWVCYNDNAAVMSLNGSLDSTLSDALSKIRSKTSDTKDNEILARKPIYLHLCHELEKNYDNSVQIKCKDGRPPPIPLHLQASFLLRSAITPADHQMAAHSTALATLRRTISVYWVERCLMALLAAAKKECKTLGDFLNQSSSETTSALMMADFLSVQVSLNSRSEAIVTQIYDQLDSKEHAAVWTTYVKALHEEKQASKDMNESSASFPEPPSRDTCFICEKSVPFKEVEIACESGHVLERCFLSFRYIATMEVWKCIGCGASASKFDVSDSSRPFYLLYNEATSINEEVATSKTKVICRLCGSYCSFLSYQKRIIK